MITVIIPLYKVKLIYLGTLFDSVEQLINVRKNVSFIFVVNDLNINFYLSEFNNLKENVTFVICDQKGSYMARNLGSTKTSSKYLFFIDADVYFTPHQFNEVLDEALPLLSKTVYFPKITQSKHVHNIWSEFDTLTGLPQKRYYGNGWLPSAAMLISAENFKYIGGFDQTLFSGADFYFCRKSTQFGLRIKLSKNAVFYHHARAEITELIKKNKRTAVGIAKNPHIKIFFKLFRLLPPIHQFIDIVKSNSNNKTILVLLSLFLWQIRLLYFCKTITARDIDDR